MRRIAAMTALLLAGCTGQPVPEGGTTTTTARTDAAAESQEVAVETPAAAREISWTGVLSEEDFKVLHDLKEGEVPELAGSMIDLAGGKAYLSLPEGAAPLPGVIVIQEWWGLNDNIKLWADRLALEGYAALAVDLYDGTVATTREGAMEAMNAVKDERAREILKAAHAFLVNDARVKAPRTGSIGWCFGGGWSLRLAIAEPELDACVMYYGRPVEDAEELARIRAPILGVFGTLDTGIPPEVVDSFEKALQAAGKDYQFHRYEAEHAFANPSSARYDEENAGKAWNVARQFLEYHVKRPERPGGR